MPSRPAAASEARWRRCDGLVTLIGLLGLLAWDASRLDLPVDRLFGTAQGFAWREHWLSAGLAHQGGRWLAALVLIGLAVNAVWPLGAHMRRLTRAERLWWLATSAAALTLPALIKQHSLSSCPWELQDFGGPAVWVSHWAWGIGDGGPGHCFPSGHAAAAFGFLPGWFVLRGRLPRLARAWLAAVLLLGLAYGVSQLVRGAHHPSHSAWTAWLCWTFAATAWQLRTARPGLSPARRPPAA